MTDLTVETGEAAQASAGETFVIALKGDSGQIEINTAIHLADDNVYKAVMQAGLEAIFGKANGAAKILAGITKLEGTELEKRKQEVREAAAKTLDQLTQGIIPGAKRAKASGAEATEAMRLAKNMVKDLIRNSGQKIGAYTAKELTAAAKVVLERNPHLMDLAKKNLAERATEAKGTKALDLSGLFGSKATSDEVKAKPKVAPTRKPKGDKAPLSAKQAGMAAPRQKPSQATAH
jgi:hypothetical protein